MARLPLGSGQRVGPDSRTNQTESDLIRRELKRLKDEAWPQYEVRNFYLTGAQVAQWFDSTGRGFRGKRFEGKAICNGNNGTPNGDQLFLRWNASVAGGTGGSDSSAHTHPVTSNVTSAANTGSYTLTTTDIPAHSHTINGYVTSNEAAGYGLTAVAGFQDRVLVNTAGGQSSTNTGGGGGHAHTSPALTNNAVTSGAASATDNRPAYLELVPVMRL